VSRALAAERSIRWPGATVETDGRFRLALSTLLARPAEEAVLLARPAEEAVGEVTPRLRVRLLLSPLPVPESTFVVGIAILPEAVLESVILLKSCLPVATPSAVLPEVGGFEALAELPCARA